MILDDGVTRVQMHRNFQFNLNSGNLESIESLLARKAPLLDLLQNKALKAQIIRGTLVLEDGAATLFALKGLLKAHGCKFDAATKTWRRSSATVAERYAIDVLKAREATQDAQIFDAITAHVNAIDARLRNAVWVGMPCKPTIEITPEARERAWTNHGLEPPSSFGGPRRDAYGNMIYA